MLPPMTTSRLLALAALLLTFGASASAQTSDERRVILTDGTVLIGTVDDESADPVVVRSRSGIEQRVRRADIAEILPLIAGRFTRTDPTRTRTILSPTGRTLGSGTKRLGTALYLIPNASFGVTDRIDLSGTALLAIGDGGGVLPALGAKVGLVDTGTVSAAAGAAVAFPITGDSDVNGSVLVTPYVAITVGSELRSFTLGATGAFGRDGSSGDTYGGDGVLFQLGGHSQISNSVALVGEVLIPVADGGNGLDSTVGILPGVRFFGDKYSVDVYGVLDLSEFVGFAPLANFAYTF